MALSVLIDGVERVGSLRDRSLRLTQKETAFATRVDFGLVNQRPDLIDTLVIADGATTYFDGYVLSVRCTEWAPGEYFCDVGGNDDITTWATEPAPFALADRDAETAYTDVIAGAVGNPYCWWRLGEASGTTATDERGVQDGTYVDTPTLGVAGAMNTGDTAVTFNGTSEYVTCGNAHLAGQTNFSIACWANSSSTNAVQIMYAEREATVTNPVVQFYLDANGRPTFSYRDNAGTTDTVVPASGDWTDGAWHHFMVTKSGTAVTIYVDGTSVKTATLTAGNTLSGTLLAKIGYNGFAGTFFPGSIDEVMIWRSAVVADSVLQLYTMGNVKRYVTASISFTSDGTNHTRTYTVSTHDAGLAPGQQLTILSENLGLLLWSTFTINELQVQWLTSTTLLYTATCGDTPIRLAAAFP